MTKMFRIAVTALALSAIAVPTWAAEDKTAVADPIAARVNGQEIHYSEVIHEVQSLGAAAQQIPPQMLYPQLLKKMVITKLVSKQGYAQGLQNDKETKARVKQAEEKIVADIYIHKVIQPKITEDKIKARYNELSAKFKPEDEVRASHILVQTEAEAEDVIKQLKSGTDFAKLATEKSKDTGSAKQGGDLGYFTKEVMVKAFAEAAFTQKNGEISEKPVKTDFGYHVIKVVDRRKSSPPPLNEEVKDQITNQIGKEMVEEMVKNLEASAKIEKFNPDGSPMKDAPALDKKAPADKK